MSRPIVVLSGVGKVYSTGRVSQRVLADVSLEIGAGEVVSIVGRSGSGKTTLLNVIGGLDRGYDGVVRVADTDLAGLSDAALARFRNRNVGFVFQSFNLLDHLTCVENVALPAFFHDGERIGTARRHAREALARVGIAEKADESPANLSGGQKQRVAIARALLNHPPILLCDEPTGNLDSETGRQIIDLFIELNRRDNLSLVVVTHEERVSRATGRIVHIADGRVVAETAAAS